MHVGVRVTDGGTPPGMDSTRRVGWWVGTPPNPLSLRFRHCVILFLSHWSLLSVLSRCCVCVGGPSREQKDALVSDRPTYKKKRLWWAWPQFANFLPLWLLLLVFLAIWFFQLIRSHPPPPLGLGEELFGSPPLSPPTLPIFGGWVRQIPPLPPPHSLWISTSVASATLMPRRCKINGQRSGGVVSGLHQACPAPSPGPHSPPLVLCRPFLGHRHGHGLGLGPQGCQGRFGPRWRCGGGSGGEEWVWEGGHLQGEAAVGPRASPKGDASAVLCCAAAAEGTVCSRDTSVLYSRKIRNRCRR